MIRNEKIINKAKGLYEFDWLKQVLGQINPLKGDYTFGKQRNVRVQHNLLDELVNRATEKLFFNRYEDINPEIKIGTRLGKNKRFYTNLKASRDNIGLDFGIKF
tara:strand:- start:56 stop:367 length:312 start_codon:yes stop_codon:yes gene_type:complete